MLESINIISLDHFALSLMQFRFPSSKLAKVIIQIAPFEASFYFSYQKTNFERWISSFVLIFEQIVIRLADFTMDCLSMQNSDCLMTLNLIPW